MSASTKIVLLSAIFLVAVFTIVSQWLPVRTPTVTQPSFTINTGELTRDVLVGQTFRSHHSNLSAVSVLFATYSNRANTEPVHFHLRESLEARGDLRRVTIHPAVLRDNQFYRFEFEPIEDSQDKNYFFFITSPESTPGNAVTIDLDTRNPYHLGSAFVVRGQGPQLTNPSILARSGKPTHDLGFETYHTVPLRVAVVSKVRETTYHIIGTWEERRGQYVVWAKALAPTILFIALSYVLYRRSRHDPTGQTQSRRFIVSLLLLFIILGLSLRVMYASALPFTEDEGNYLYDARTLREGMLAGGDGYVKSPLMIMWVSLWQTLLGNTLLAGRLSSIVIGALTLIPLYAIGCRLKNRYTGLLTAAAWALFGAPVVFNIYVHTQPVALFFGVSGIALLWHALGQASRQRSSLLVPLPRYTMMQLFLSGVLLGLGVASRKSILAIGLVPLLLIILESRSWRQRWQYLTITGAGFAIVIGVLVAAAYWLYGSEGLWEVLGVNSATDGIAIKDESEQELERNYSLRGMTPFFRESLPLILLTMIGWGVLLEQSARRYVQKIIPPKPGRSLVTALDQVLPKIAWLPAVAAFAWCWQFFLEYEGQLFMVFGMTVLWFTMAAVILIIAVWPRPAREAVRVASDQLVVKSTQPAKFLPNMVGTPRSTVIRARFQLSPSESLLPLLAAVFVLPAWIGGLAFFYINWIKFHANYLSEFMPPAIILTGVGMLTIWERLASQKKFVEDHPLLTIARRLILIFSLVVVTWAGSLSNYITYNFAHTGTFDQASTLEAAAWARTHIPLPEPIFTGASLVTYLSGHHNALNISHPRWYAYESIRKDSTRLNTFMPSVEEMLQAYRSSNWFLLDKQTGFSYLMEYSEIEAGLSRDFEIVQQIENGSNTLTFYRRAK